MKKKMVKKLLSGMMILMLGVSIVSGMPQEVQAAENVVKYQDVTYTDFQDCISNQKAPECTLTGESAGYLFAGWYLDEGNTAVKTVSEVQADMQVKAKFVPARLTGVFCQNEVGVNSTSGSTNMRIISAVDSTNYKAVGFNVYGRKEQEDGTFKEWKMYQYDATNGNKAEKKSVYSGLKTYHLDAEGNPVEDAEPTKPADLFGTDAEGFYFTAMTLSSIPRDYFNTSIAIKPYWITLDGTYVEGIGEFDRVQDGIDGIVNVSVNLKNTKDIAAGMVNVTIPEGFTYVGAECGRVFEEMETAQNGNTIKCIATVADIGKNSTKPNEVYVNLKLKKVDGATLIAGKSVFTVSIPENGFCDMNEQFSTNVTAWDVVY